MVTLDLAFSNVVLMVSSTKLKNDFMVATRNKDYINVNPMTGHATDQPTSFVTYPSYPTPNAFPTELTIKPPKEVIHKFAFNPCVRDAHNYNIF